MAAPKALTGALADVFAKLGSKLEARTGPMSAEGQKALQNLSPDEAIALDQLLEGGAKLGEVQGTGATSDDLGPIWDANDARNPNGADSTLADRNKLSSPYPGPSTQNLSNAVDRHASDGIHAGELWDRVHEVVDANNYMNRTKGLNPESGLPWPHGHDESTGIFDSRRSWLLNENIPGIAAGAVGAGTVLAAGNAQAQQPPEEIVVPDDAVLASGSEEIAVPPDAVPTGIGGGDDDEIVVPPDAMPAGSAEVAGSPGVVPPGKPADLSKYFKQPQQPQMSFAPPAPLGGAEYLMDRLQNPEPSTFSKVVDSGLSIKRKLDEMERKYVTPIVGAVNAMTQLRWFGKIDPAVRERLRPAAEAIGPGAVKFVEILAQLPEDESGLGSILRREAPTAALGVERFTKYMLGPTGWNKGDPSLTLANFTPFAKLGPESQGTPEDMSPDARRALDEAGQRYGEIAVGTGLSLATWLPEAPLFLVGAGKSVVTQAVTGALATAALDPDINATEAVPAALVLAGGIKGAGALYKGAKAAGREARQWFKGSGTPASELSVTPMYVVPGEDVGGLARRVMDEAYTIDVQANVTEAKVASELATVGKPMIIVEEAAGSTAAGSPRRAARRAALVADKKGNVKAVPFRGEIPKDVPVVDTTGVKVRRPPVQTKAQPTDLEKALNNWEDEVFESSDIYGEPSSRLSAADRAQLVKPNGLVLVVQQGKGGVAGTAQLHHVDDPALQLKIMQAREPFEVTLEDGSKKIAFLNTSASSTDGTKKVLVLKVDPAEGIPNALDRDIIVNAKDTRELGYQEIRDLLARREAEMADDEVASTVVRRTQPATVPTPLKGLPEGSVPPPPPAGIPSALARRPAPLTGEVIDPAGIVKTQEVIDAEYSVAYGAGAPPGAPRLPSYGDGPPPPNFKALPANGTDMDALPMIKYGAAKVPYLNAVMDSFRRGAKLAGAKFLHPVHTLPEELFEASARVASRHFLENQRQRLLKSFQQYVPEIRNLGSEDAQRIGVRVKQFLNGTLNIDELHRLEPSLKATAVRYVEARKANLEANHEELVRLGIMPRQSKWFQTPQINIDDLTPKLESVFKTKPKGLYSPGLPPKAKQPLLEAYAGEDAAFAAARDPLDIIWDAPTPSTATPDEFYDYSARLYWSFLLEPGEYAKLARKNASKYNYWIDEMAKLVKMDNPEWGPEAVKATARRVVEDAISGDGGSLSAYHSLRSRKTSMPLWYREMLGEVEDGFLKMADTEVRQASLISLGKAWETVSKNPMVAVRPDAITDDLIEEGWRQVTGRRFGLANGMYIRPDVREALTRAPETQKEMHRFVTKLVNLRAWNQTVGNIATHSANALGNVQGMFLSNLADPISDPFTFRAALRDVAKDWVAHTEQPMLKRNFRSAQVQRAMELGLLGSDVITAEFKSNAGAYFKRMLKATEGQTSFFDSVAGVYSTSVKGLNSMYALTDPLFKYWTWKAGMRKAGVVDGSVVNRSKTMKWLLDNVGSRYATRDGYSTEAVRSLLANTSNANLARAVEVEAAKRIHRAFPMVDRIGQIPEKIATSPLRGTIVNTYFRTGSELFRVFGSIPWRMKNEPGFMARMLRYTAVSGTLLAGVKAFNEMNGVSGEVIDAALATAPPSERMFKHGRFHVGSQNEDGSLDFIDLSRWFAPFQWITGDPDESMVKRLALNIPGIVTSGTMGGDAAEAALDRLGIAKSPRWNTEIPEWQRGDISTWLRTADQLSLLPGTAGSVYSTLEKAEIGFEAKTSTSMPSLETPPEWMTALNLALGPGTFARLGTPAQRERALANMRAEIRQLRKQYFSLRHKTEGQSLGRMAGPLDMQAAVDKQEELIKQKVLEYQELEEKLNLLRR